MFGIGMTELLVILALALLVIGPRKLPELARTLGKGLAEFRKATQDVRDTIDREIHAQDFKNAVSDVKQEFTSKVKDMADLEPGDPEVPDNAPPDAGAKGEAPEPGDSSPKKEEKP